MTIHSGVYLVTLDAVREQLNAEPGASYQDDETLLLRFIGDATAMAHQFCRRSFVPYRQTKTFDARGDWVDGRTLTLNADLLDAITITNGDGSVITDDQYLLRDRNRYPRHEIKLKASSNLIWTSDGYDWEDAITIDGIWGYHESYDQAWVDSGDTVQDAGGVDAAATAITVTDAGGQDARFNTRFQVGQVLRIDDEYLILTAVDAGTNTLTVRRGQLGTTATAHETGAAIYTYAPMDDVARAIASLAIWLYRNKATQGDEVFVLSDGSKMINNQAPSNIRDTLRAYVWWDWGF